ncbi:MAG: hypothetical protein IPJ30_14225 [Acidobacteria bacterium]|nr:hypothetical protein [Acidobacteriota bacterium]
MKISTVAATGLMLAGPVAGQSRKRNRASSSAPDLPDLLRR